MNGKGSRSDLQVAVSGSYMGSTVEGVINLRLYCMVDVTNIDILKLCGVHIDLICPNKMWSTIILLILVKCYKSQQ